MQLPKIHVSDAVQPDTIHFFVPRERVRVTLPDGSVKEYYVESEERWVRKCAVIKGLKTE